MIMGFLSERFLFTTENTVIFAYQQADAVCISLSILFACFTDHEEVILNLTKCLFHCRYMQFAEIWAKLTRIQCSICPNLSIQHCRLPLKLKGFTPHKQISLLDWIKPYERHKNHLMQAVLGLRRKPTPGSTWTSADIQKYSIITISAGKHMTGSKVRTSICSGLE